MGFGARQVRAFLADRSERSGQLMSDEDAGKAQRVMKAMLLTRKIDVAGLKRAHAAQMGPAVGSPPPRSSSGRATA